MISLRFRIKLNKVRYLSTSIDLSKSTILEVSNALQQGELQAEQLTSWSLDHLEKANNKLNCLTSDGIWREEAEKAALLSGERIRSGNRSSLLDGIPLTIKDNFCVKGHRTTAASNILGKWIPPYDASAVECLNKGGAVIIGQNNMDEFGMGSATVYSRYGHTKNPWSKSAIHEDNTADEVLSAGGSSGGGASSVASGGSFAALGSDTGGSVRQPAAWCGIVGLKPSYGRISRHGLIAYSSSLDCPGIMTRSVGDAALMLDCLASSTPDKRDSMSAIAPPHSFNLPTDSQSFLNAVLSVRGEEGFTPCLKGTVIGIPKEYSVDGLHESGESCWLQCMQWLEELGAEVVPVSIPSVPYALPAYYVLACAEASSNLSRFDGLRYGLRGGTDDSQSEGNNGDDSLPLHESIFKARSLGFGEEVQRRILCGTFVLGASSYASYYEQALKVRSRLIHDFDSAFLQHESGKRVDILLTPSAPSPPMTIAEALSQESSPVDAYVNDVMTVPASLAKIPALALPISTTQIQTGNSITEVPVGVQLMARRFDERSLLRVGGALEAVAKFNIPPDIRNW